MPNFLVLFQMQKYETFDEKMLIEESVVQGLRSEEIHQFYVSLYTTKDNSFEILIVNVFQ